MKRGPAPAAGFESARAPRPPPLFSIPSHPASAGWPAWQTATSWSRPWRRSRRRSAGRTGSWLCADGEEDGREGRQLRRGGAFESGRRPSAHRARSAAPRGRATCGGRPATPRQVRAIGMPISGWGSRADHGRDPVVRPVRARAPHASLHENKSRAGRPRDLLPSPRSAGPSLTKRKPIPRRSHQRLVNKDDEHGGEDVGHPGRAVRDQLGPLGDGGGGEAWRHCDRGKKKKRAA